ncbi:NAD-dependent epimerase/dehydratase family protein [Flavobacteriaceae bacterium F89]|uniref:NAD-dependent epimerase/dehydratase family protein n=1 Tax=Cerina litoralis TaxID=2874477 RepID=A0AAE3JUD4_9FLAO|nr:NAD-dependent epimerase/dehydratase family protein [Cerina litoralis]MCG2462287.1 NAD-dependent epimerase/dehydratase family protein [Cerina litoralis]
MKRERILVTGALGQLGTVLTSELRKMFGMDSIIASDLRECNGSDILYVQLDVADRAALQKIVDEYAVTQIYHLAAVLSANGEKQPLRTWDVNCNTFLNVLEVAKVNKLKRVFFPSSIAVFGTNVPKMNTPQAIALNPRTVYGISKVAGENWSQYYYDKFGLDVRSIRYPGLIGHQSLPGGGTTDYAVDIYHKAVRQETFNCYLRPDTHLPMMFITDAVRATLELMEAPKDNITIRTSYNLQGVSFSPEEIAESIKVHYPNFQILYSPDHRQEIADSWPKSLNDSDARADWKWAPQYGLQDITMEMISEIEKKKQLELKKSTTICIQ